MGTPWLSKRNLVAFFLTAGAAFTLYYWWNLSRPVALMDAQTDHLSCVSYAPFHREGQTPFDQSLSISAEQIEADMTALARRFDCVRTYTVTHGMQEVPRFAEKLGVKVLLGLWIGRNPSDNAKEIATGIALTKKYTDNIRGVIVGNEVLLRRELSPAMLRNYIEQVKAAVSVPVTYADTWDYWLRYQNDLLDAVSFATVHILPYWEDDPAGIANAVDHVSEIYQHTKTEMQGKEVLIGETGWPSYGRQRQAAEPSLINQARFIREFSLRAEQENIPYNVIEAFDQPWKRFSEGAVGGYWGIYAADEAAKFPFRGPVAEVATWSAIAYAAMAVCFGLFLCLHWKHSPKPLNTLPALLVISISGGGAWTAFCRELVMANRNLLEWAYTGFFASLLLALIFLLGRLLANWCGGQHLPQALPPINQVTLGLRFGLSGIKSSAQLLSILRYLFLFSAALACLLLAFDNHSHDFPLALFSLPAIGLTLLSWIKVKSEAGLEEILLAGWLGFAGLWKAVLEHVVIVQDKPWHLANGINQHALLWSLLCLLLSSSVLGPILFELRASQRVRF
jgi:exo-beta-1,3-glucanase (GH17 family)